MGMLGRGNALCHIRNCNSFARGVNAARESAPARIERTRRSDDATALCLGPCHAIPEQGKLPLLLRSVTQDSRYAETRERTLPLRLENCRGDSLPTAYHDVLAQKRGL